jgi:hypothetical protein
MTIAWRILSTSMAIWITMENSAWADRQVKNNLYSVWCRPILHEAVSTQRQTNSDKLRHKTYISFSDSARCSESSVANVTINQGLDVAIHTVLAWRILSTSMVIWITVGNSAWADRQVKNNLYSVRCHPILHEPVSMYRQTNSDKPRHKTYISFPDSARCSVSSIATVTINHWLDVAIHTVISAWCIWSLITCGLRQQKNCSLFIQYAKPKCASSETYTAYSVISSCSASPINCTVLISGEFLQQYG